RRCAPFTGRHLESPGVTRLRARGLGRGGASPHGEGPGGSVVRSMTGFGSASREGAGATVSVEIRSVNHRQGDVRLRVSGELQALVAEMEEALRTHVVRGRLDATVSLRMADVATLQIDRDLARKAYGDLTALRDELCPGEPVPFSMLTQVPHLFSSRSESSELSEGVRETVLDCLKEAIAVHESMRVREGQALHADLSTRLGAIMDLTEKAKIRAPKVVDTYRDRLRDRIERLLEGSSVSLDEGRLEHEVAFFADRADVTEELTRLDSHCVQFRGFLEGNATEIGKRLDFLLQEMGREVNTLGSKANDTELTNLVIDMKAELGRLREQVQNVL
ncbi:MAG: YicC family protein, partial [Myxococcales bacterium]|nr:YicC family protein [Myxococcales bacterium]